MFVCIAYQLSQVVDVHVLREPEENTYINPNFAMILMKTTCCVTIHELQPLKIPYFSPSPFTRHWHSAKLREACDIICSIILISLLLLARAV